MEEPIKVEIVNDKPINVNVKENKYEKKLKIYGTRIAILAGIIAILAYFNIKIPEKQESNTIAPVAPVQPINPNIDFELLGVIYKYDYSPKTDNIIYLDQNNNYQFQDDNHSGRYYTNWLNDYENDKKKVIQTYNIEDKILELEMLGYVRFYHEKGLEYKELQITYEGKEAYKNYLR